MIVWELGNYRFSLFDENGQFLRHFKPKHPAVVWKLKSLENGKVVFEVREGYCEKELGYRPVFADDGTLWTVLEGKEGYNAVV